MFLITRGSTKCVVEAYISVSNVIETLEGVRLNINHYHANWYKTATELAESVGVKPSLPRLTAKMKHRSNIPGEDEEVYCRRNITVPVLDEVNFFLVFIYFTLFRYVRKT